MALRTRRIVVPTSRTVGVDRFRIASAYLGRTAINKIVYTTGTVSAKVDNILFEFGEDGLFNVLTDIPGEKLSMLSKTGNPSPNDFDVFAEKQG